MTNDKLEMIPTQHVSRKTENLTFGEATTFMKEGLAVRRPEWDELDCIGLAKTEVKFIRIGKKPPLLGAEDIFATDWEVA